MSVPREQKKSEEWVLGALIEKGFRDKEPEKDWEKVTTKEEEN